jgi:hypothetical protein
MEPRMKLLVARWERRWRGSVQTVVRRAVARGHQFRVLGTAGLRSRFESAGAGLRVYQLDFCYNIDGNPASNPGWHPSTVAGSGTTYSAAAMVRWPGQ